MPYEINWDIPDVVLCVKLLGQVSIEEFLEINEQVNAHLDACNTSERNLLVIDTIEAQRIPRELSSMKNSQTYANRVDLKWIMIVGDNKTIRLIMLLTFNLSKAILQFADNYVHVERFIQNMRLVAK